MYCSLRVIRNQSGEDCFRWVDLTLDVPLLLLFLLLHRRDQVHLPYQVGSTHKKASKLSFHLSPSVEIIELMWRERIVMMRNLLKVNLGD